MVPILRKINLGNNNNNNNNINSNHSAYLLKLLTAVIKKLHARIKKSCKQKK